MNAARAQHIVVYWGRRGGGLDLFDLFVEECKERNLPIIASARPTVSRQDGQSSFISFFNLRAWFIARKSLLRQAAEGGIRSVVIMMSSPWDLFLGMRLEKSGVQVVRIIHDANPHPGERFPPNFWINLLTKDCSRIVTLSNYVARQLTTSHGVDPTKIMVCSFPTPKIENNQVKKASSPRKILLIGRGKKYQGQKLLEEAWDLIDKTDKALVIAGEGFKPNPKHSDIEYKNWWMTREEMIDEISSSDLVVFPYTEASQSGTIPICRALGKPVVVTPFGGLMEQVEERVNGLICEEVGKVKLAQSITDALQMHWGTENFNKVSNTVDLVDGCLSVKLEFSRKPTDLFPMTPVYNFPNVPLTPIKRKKPLRVVIFIALTQTWNSVAPVWAKLSADCTFQVTLVLVPGISKNEDSEEFRKMLAFFDDSNISYIVESDFSLKVSNPHFALYTMPYHSMYSHNTRPAFLATSGVRVCYIPYACEVGGGLANLHFQYQSEAVNVAWRIFARSHAQSINFKKLHPQSEDRVVVTGHPRAEYKYETGNGHSHPAAQKSKGRPIIVWNPHFSINGTRTWSTFLHLREEIKSLIIEYKEIFFLVRPHPLLMKDLENHPEWGSKMSTEWFNCLDLMENAMVDHEVDYRKCFGISSGLITDTSSLMVEYLLVNKPICHLYQRDSIGLSGELSNFDFFHKGTSKQDIREFLNGVLSSNDQLSELRNSARGRYFGPMDLIPSSEIVKHLCDARPFEEFGVPVEPLSEQDLSFEYWQTAKSTFLAPEEYYRKKEVEILEVLQSYAQGSHAADIGCGNGRFTFLISNFFETVAAIDPSEYLIFEAIDNAKVLGVSNIDFKVDRLETTVLLSTYDVVSVMGVLSGFLSDVKFEQSIHRIKALLKPRGILILSETLSLSERQQIDSGGYHAVYRNLDVYLLYWKEVGFSLLESRVLSQDSESLRMNSIYVFRLDH